MVNEDFTKFGIDLNSSCHSVKLGHKQKIREAQAASIQHLMGLTGCKWTSAVSEIADLSGIHMDINMSPLTWSA